MREIEGHEVTTDDFLNSLTLGSANGHGPASGGPGDPAGRLIFKKGTLSVEKVSGENKGSGPAGNQ